MKQAESDLISDDIENKTSDFESVFFQLFIISIQYQ